MPGSRPAPPGLENRLVDAIVLAHKALRNPELLQLRVQFPALPVVVYAPFRPDDGELLVRLHRPGGVTAVAVEGVDDAVVGELVRRSMLSHQPPRAGRSAPRMLRLTEPIQQRAWELLVEAWPSRSGPVPGAAAGISREHLSRQFGAGGAPNLKRVIDLSGDRLRRPAARQPGVQRGGRGAAAALRLGQLTWASRRSGSRG